MASERINASKFAEMLGVGPSSISHILAGRNNPGYELIVKILEVFPAVNPEWLLLGKGDIYSTERVPERTLFDLQPGHQDADAASMTEGASESGVSAGTATTEFTLASTLDDAFSTRNSTAVNTPADQSKPLLQAEPDIERIIIFYSDSTFSTYKLR